MTQSFSFHRVVRELSAGAVPVVALLLLSSGTASPLVAQTCAPQNACTDPRGCPDFVVDEGTLRAILGAETRTFADTDCAVVEGEVPAGTNRFIYFATTIVNIGPGAITLGNPADHPEWFELETCHGHPHIREYADYRIWPIAAWEEWRALRTSYPDACADDLLAANAPLAAKMIRGAKRGFCLYDVVLISDLPNATVVCPEIPDPLTYPDCTYSGLGVCWADIYEPIPGFTDGQWISITGLPTGDYVLENEANARHFFDEADFKNNTAFVKFRHRNGRIRVLRR
jgi:hypothetical protein